MNINKTTILGRLTKDPELRYAASGTAIASLDLAVNRRVKKGDEWVDETTFINDITLWGKTAETAGKYLSKGSTVYLEGRLQLDTWKDKETGNSRSKLKIVGESMQFVGKSEKPQQKPEQPPVSNINDEDDMPF